MAKLSIHSLGPINQFTMDIKKIHLFIGEQATGKSTISKAIYYFRTLNNILIEHLYAIALGGEYKEEERFPKMIKKKLKDYFVELFGYSWNLPESLEIQYELSDEKWILVTVKRGKGRRYLSVTFSPNFTKKMQQYEKDSLEYYKDLLASSSNILFERTERQRIHQEIYNKVSELFEDRKETYYIPAGRSLMTLMTNQKTKLDYGTMDLVNRRFMQFIESIQPKFDMGIRQAHKYFPSAERKFDIGTVSAKMIENLKGEYCYTPGKEYLELKGGQEKIPINFASSGQQESLWLLNQLYVLMLRNESAFVIVEEPEAHLYPTLQKEVVEFLIQFANLTDSHVVITTHSPYVLTCLNNLLYAGRIKNQEKVEKLIGKYKTIRKEDVFACKLKKCGNVTETVDLVNQDDGELKTELIDDISDEVNRVYTELFYLEDEMNGDTQ